MKIVYRFLVGSLAAIVLLAVGGCKSASSSAPVQSGPVIYVPSDLQWPHFYATNGYEFAVYQPQVSSWPGNKMEGRFVVAIRASGTTEETYGVAFFKARTDIDKVNRLVTLED